MFEKFPLLPEQASTYAEKLDWLFWAQTGFTFALSLLIFAVSARGSASTAQSCEHGIRMSAVEGAIMPHFFVGASIVSLICLIGTAGAYGAWKKQEDEE